MRHQPAPALPCTEAREALSTEQDGEGLALRLRSQLADHLEVCDGCARFAGDIAGLARRTRVGAAEEVPDLSVAITRRVAAELPAGYATSAPSPSGSRVRTRDLRRLVALAGVAQFVLAMPMLLGLVGPDVHAGRDLGALQVALGVGLVCAALQPRRASGLLPVLAVVAATTVVAGVLDVAMGVASLAAELTHLSELIGVVALWALARRTAQRPAAMSPTAVPAGTA